MVLKPWQASGRSWPRNDSHGIVLIVKWMVWELWLSESGRLLGGLGLDKVPRALFDGEHLRFGSSVPDMA